MDLLKFIGVDLNTLTDNPIIVELLAGAAEGIIIGLIVGAVVWAIMTAPDTLGRGLLIAIIFGIIVIIWEFARIGSVIGSGMGGIIESFNNNPALGEMFLNAGTNFLAAMLVGALIGVGSQAPQAVLKGGIIGIFLGALVGAALGAGLNYFGVNVNQIVFRGLIVLGVWAILVTVSGSG